MKKIIYFTILVLLLTSCHEVYLDHPIPIDAEPITKIPKEIRGDWAVDSWLMAPEGERIFYSIKKKKIVAYKEEKVARNDLDSLSLAIKNNKIYNYSEDSLTGYDFITRNDTLYFFLIERSEMKATAKNQLRSSGKYFFMNEINDKGWWFVNILGYDDDQLSIRMMSLESAKLASEYGFEVTENDPFATEERGVFDNPQNYLQGEFTSSELNKFVEQDGFPDTLAVFTRVKNLKKILCYKE